MNNITINESESQEDNQKTTPVEGSLSESKMSNISLPDSISQIWLGIKNDYRTLIGVDNLEIIEKADDEDEENSDV